MSKKDGGWAFPTDHSADAECTNITGGMTLRDYFAAKAMAALMSWHGEDAWKTIRPFEVIAKEAYTQADAMLEARKQ
jgi:hypothetical protein